MSDIKRLVPKTGTAAQHEVYESKDGELTYNTDTQQLVVHDGETAGGHPVARDSEVVHLDTAETISGQKTFTAAPTYVLGEGNIVSNGSAALLLQNTSVTKGTPDTTKNYYWTVPGTGASGTATKDRLGMFEVAYRNDGSAYAQLAAYTPEEDSETYNYLRISCEADGTAYAECPTPADSSDSSTKVATTAWVDATLAASGVRYASSVGYNNIMSPDEEDNELKTYKWQVVDFNNYHTAGEYHVRWYYGDEATTDADGNVIYPTLNAPNIDSTISWWDGILTVRVVGPATSASYWRRWIYDLVVMRDQTNGHIGQRYIRSGWTSSSYTDKTVPAIFSSWYRVATDEVDYGNSTYTAEVAAATASVAALSLDADDDEYDSSAITSDAISAYEANTNVSAADIIASVKSKEVGSDA